MESPLMSDRRRVRADFVSVTYSKMTLALLLPVSITVVAVVWSAMNLTPLYADQDASPLYLVSDEENATSATGKLGASILNALAVVVVLVVATFAMVVLYKLGCQKILVGWLVLSAVVILFLLFWLWFDLVCVRFQLPYEIVTTTIALWNVGAVGLVSIFYYAPPLVTQTYLVMVSVVASWMMTRLPEWSAWAILIAVATYDIVAVLCPKGPLRLLLEEAQRRKEPIPGFIYDSSSEGAFRLTSAAVVESSEASCQPHSLHADSANPASSSIQAREAPGDTPVPSYEGSATAEPSATYAESETGAEVAAVEPTAATPATVHIRSRGGSRSADSNDEDPTSISAVSQGSPFKLGLGDFIFYGLLVGKAAPSSLPVWVMSFSAIVVGLVGTLTSLLFLRNRNRALPALPISIFLGVATYFLARFTVLPLSVFVSWNVLAL